MTQMFEYNHDDLDQQYTKPVVDLRMAKKNLKFLTKGMSEHELSDFNQALNQLEEYDRIYSLVEYTSVLHDGITALM